MASSAVNRPTDIKQKETDVNAKLQLYGIYAAFANGKVPSNKQIDVALNSALASKGLSSPSDKLSEEGRRLVADLREVIEQAKYLLLSKNEGNVLQEFIWETQHISTSVNVPGAPVEKEAAQKHGEQVLGGLRTLGTLILSNGQFRKLLNDATILIRDMAGDAATNAAGRVNPTEEQLAQIDKPADDNVWHDVPDLSRQNLKAQARAAYDKQKPFGRGDVQKAAGDATQAAHPTGARDPADLAAMTAQDQQEGTASGIDAQQGLQAGAQNLRQAASDNVPEETKQQVRNRTALAKNYLSKKMPQERREQAIWRLKKMVVEIQGHEDYQQAIETLLDLAETYAGHGKTFHEGSKGTVKGAHSDSALQQAEFNLKTLVERFANSTSTDDLWDSINNIYRDAEKDPELKNWFKSVDDYIRRCLKEQGYILQPAADQEWDHLYDKGRFLLRERYRDHTNRILDEIKFLADQFDQDPQNKRFGQAVQKLFNELGNDENGKPKFKKHLVKDLTEIIIPGIFENVRYVPIPRIEVSDPMIDAIVENLVIESDNLMPNVFEISSDNYFRFGRKNIGNKKTNKAMISVSGVQLDLKDVSYYVKKKQGFPSLTDTGVLDLYLGGQGLSFKIAMASAEEKDRQNFFKVEKVNIDMKHFKIKVKKSKHKILFALFKPILLKAIRPALQKALEKQIKDSFTQADAMAYDINQDVKRAKKAALNDPENAQNIYQQYAQATQKRFMASKQKVDRAKESKVNMAVTQQDSIFKDISLPGGISTKATEYKELASKGEKWESPVFSIGTAPESKDIPQLAQVTRKPHNATSGGLRSANGATYNSGAANFSNQVDQAFSKSDGSNRYTNGHTVDNTVY
ncbi:MAG: hypothetical protein M1834_003521 [Cirrosporium novae-zelandiae]|nr:MAG: hypothetical protein M1834_003521 [Cirrosporium novae-zelandiae]